MYHLCFTIVALFHKPIERSVLFFLFPFYLTKKNKNRDSTKTDRCTTITGCGTHCCHDRCLHTFISNVARAFFLCGSLSRENARTENRRVEQNDSCI